MAVAYTLSNNDAFKASESLYLNDNLADVHFLFTTNEIEEKIPAHKLILSVLSPVFQAMFFGPLKEEGNVLIVDADADAFKEFLQFFYLRKVSLSMTNMKTVVRLADKYDVLKYVENACSTLHELAFVSDQEYDVNTENVCWVYQLAHYVDYYPLLNKCENIIFGSTFEVLKTNAFLQIDREILESILNLNVERQEVALFSGVLRWAERGCRRAGLMSSVSNCKMQLGDCLKLIRYCKLDISIFSKVVAMNPGLFTTEEFQDIILMKTVKDYKPQIYSRYIQYFSWNTKKLLHCQRTAKVAHVIIDCRGQQVISFTSNKAILLGKIDCLLNPMRNFDLKVTITEPDALKSESYMKPKFIFRDIFKAQKDKQLEIHLRNPVLIKPNVLYKIHLHIDKSFVSNLTSCQMWEPLVELDGLQLKFHQNHPFPFDNASYGFISSLDVNLVES